MVNTEHCHNCRAPLPEDRKGYALCKACADRRRARYYYRKQNHMCTTCGRNLPDGWKTGTCQDCKNKIIDRKGKKVVAKPTKLADVLKLCETQGISYAEYSRREQLERMRCE